MHVAKNGSASCLQNLHRIIDENYNAQLAVQTNLSCMAHIIQPTATKIWFVFHNIIRVVFIVIL